MARPGKKRWRVIGCADDEAAGRLQQELGCTALSARLLVNRGLANPEDADRFLNPDFSHLSDPFTLPDAELAAERIKQALHQKEKIVVHGDYDGDGVTSAALWNRLLEKLGADVRVHVPHRKRDGYDMRSKFVQEAKAEGATLIITTDCGIQRCEEVDEAREAGLDVIVTDHHEPGPHLPKAIAVVNPHRKDSRYEFRDLAGVGVAYRMGEALVRHLGHPVNGYRRAFCDLAAIGTVTDIVPLLGDNRILVSEGLKELRVTKKPGLRALMNSAGIKERIDAESIGYRIGPRLNAIGRVDDAAHALNLLLTRDPVEAAALADKLECANNDRRLEESRILAEAMEQMAKQDLSENYCLVLTGDNWHSGVIGIVASKIRERTGRPTILIATDETTGTARGSARSIRALNIHDAITTCGDLLLEFGGHAQAAGMALSMEQISTFSEAVNRYAKENLTEEDLLPSLEIEVEIDPSQVNLRLLNELARFEPWGRNNHHPLFVSRNVRIADVLRMGQEKQHLKMRTEWDGIPTPDAVYWNAGDLADHLHTGDHIDVVYGPQTNHWNGRTTIQFRLEDLRPSDAEDW